MVDAHALPLLQRLKSAVNDADRIFELVREAEREHVDDAHALSEIYGVAVDVYGHARSAQDHGYPDLCVKYMRSLCRLNPAEAREFHNRQRAYSVGKADARMYEARAAMEERLGEVPKAVKMLQEGLKVGAQPAEVLQRNLNRLQASSAVGIDGPDRAGRPPHPVGSQPLFGALPATPQKVAVGLRAGCGSAGPLGPTPSPSGRGVASATKLRGLAPRSLRPILDIGSPMRRLDDGGDDEEEEKDDKSPKAGSDKDSAGITEIDPLESSAVASQLPTIQEVDSVDEASSRGRTSNGSGGRTSNGSGGGSSTTKTETPRGLPSGGSAASASHPGHSPSPSGNGCQATPCKRDLFSEKSVDHAERAEPTPSCDTGRSAKVIYVSGVPYTQLQTLGRGGSSKVYLVSNPAGDVYALKRVTTETAKQFEAFQNEVLLLQRLKGREHVIQVIATEIDHDRGRIHIVMEAGDMDLGRYLQSEGRTLDLHRIQDLWRQILQAVQVCHDERIVHSDLKPGNFLLVEGQLKVIDFGIAKPISDGTKNISRDASVGTLSYMAPEAVKQGQLKLGTASDVWSLGIILYQMAYGHPPFQHLDPMQRLLQLSDPDLKIKFPPNHRLETYSSTTKAQLTEVLASCLQRDARRRPSVPDLLDNPFLQTAAEVPRARVEDVVGSLMDSIVRAIGDSLHIDPQSLAVQEHEMRALKDEVFHVLATGGSSGVSPDFVAALAPLTSRLAQAAAQQGVERAMPTQGALTENIDCGNAANSMNCAIALKPKPSASMTDGGRALRSSDKENGGARLPLFASK